MIKGCKLLVAVWFLTSIGCNHDPAKEIPPYATFLDIGQIGVLSPQTTIQQFDRNANLQGSQDVGISSQDRIFTQLLPDTRHFLLATKDKVIISDSTNKEPNITLPLPKESVVGGAILSSKVFLLSSMGTLYRWDQTSYVEQTKLKWKNESTQAQLAVFSINGQRLLTISPSDPVIRVWDSQTGELLFSLTGSQGHLTPVTIATFSGDGNTVVSGDQSGVILNWDLDPAKPVISPLSVGIQTGPVTSIAFSANTRLVATGENKGDILVWKRFAFQSFLFTSPFKYILWRRFSGHSQGTNLLSFSKDNNQLVSSSLDKTVRIWNTEPEKDHSWFLPTLGFDLASDRVHFLTVGSTQTGTYVSMWNLADLRMGNATTPIPLFTQTASLRQSYYAARLSPDGRRFLASARGTVTAQFQTDVFTVAGPRHIATIKDPTVSAFSSTEEAPFFTPDGQLAISSQYNTLSTGCYDLLFWDIGSLPDIAIDPTRAPNQFGAVRCLFPDPMKRLVFSPDQKTMIVIGANDAFAKVIDISSIDAPFTIGELTQTPQTIMTSSGIPTVFPPSFVSFITWLPQKNTLFVDTADKIGQVWNVEDGTNPALKEAFIPTDFERSYPINSTQLSPDQKYLMITSGSSQIGFYDPITHQKKMSIIGGENKSVGRAAFTLDGTEMMVLTGPSNVGSFSGEAIHLFEIPSLEEIGIIQF